MIKIGDDFAVRYYLWSQQDFRREIAEGFPCLSYFKTGSAYWVVQMMSKMSSEEQYFFGRALVKRFHPRAIQLTGEVIAEEEQSLYEEYRSLAFGPTPMDLKARGGQLSGDNLIVDKNLLSKCIRSAFERHDAVRLAREAGGLCLVTTIGRWSIRTRVEMNLKVASLRYSHQIYSITELGLQQSNKSEVASSLLLAKLVSLNSWLGISNETAWYDLTEAEYLGTAKQLVNLVDHFLSVAPKLLNGL